MRFSRQQVLLIIAAALAVFCVVVWTAALAETPQHTLTFAVLNVGQGDSLYIKSPSGIEVLIDGGPNTNALLRELPHVMSIGDRHIDAIIETHPDADHMGGFIDLLQRYEVGAFIEPGIEKHNLGVDSLLREVSERDIPRYIARRGMWLDLGAGARLEILYPDHDVTNLSANKTNEGAIVAHLVYGSTSVLLTADATSKVEDHLLAISTSTDLKSDILKVGHHGSKYSSTEAFVVAVNPQVAVISVGARNSYGHPAPRVTDLFDDLKIPLFRTDQLGTIIFHSNGLQFVQQ